LKLFPKNFPYIYFFYIACGITEEIYLQNLHREVICNIEKVNISIKKEESYIDISIMIKNI